MTSTTPTPSPPLTPAEFAAQIRALVEQLDAIIPLAPRDIEEIRRNVTSARIGNDLIDPALAMINETVLMKNRGLLNTGAAGEALESRDLLLPLAQRLIAYGEAVEFFVHRKMAASGKEALAVYEHAKRLARRPEGAELRPYLERMQSVMKRQLNRRPKPAPAPPAAQTFRAVTAAEEEPIRIDDLLPEYQEVLHRLIKDGLLR